MEMTPKPLHCTIRRRSVSLSHLPKEKTIQNVIKLIDHKRKEKKKAEKAKKSKFESEIVEEPVYNSEEEG